jgi:hypothetical protein
MASTGASSNDVISFHDQNILPKFSEYRSQVCSIYLFNKHFEYSFCKVMLGELPADFLRIQLIESQVYDPFLAQQENHPNPNFLGHFTLTIAEVFIYLFT